MPAPAGALTAPPVVLLTLEHAGQTWRLSSRPCEAQDGTAWRHYRGGLGRTDVYMEAPLGEPQDRPSLPVECIAPADLAALAAQRHILGELRAELSLWREGDPLAKRYVIISGAAEVESGGYDGRPLRLTVIADDPASVLTTWPPATQRICSDTWSTAAGPARTYGETEEGAIYPQVVGQAGLIRVAGTYAAVPATPVYPVSITSGGSWTGWERYTPWGDSSTWLAAAPPDGSYGLVSSGRMYPGPASAGVLQGVIQVTCDTGATPPTWAAADVWYHYDALGQIVSLARLQAVAAWGNITAGRSYYAHIPDPCSGMASRTYAGGMEGAGEITRWALEQSMIRVDWRRTGAALPRLDRYRLGGYWDQSVSPWEWAVGSVLPILPVTWISGPDGLYPVAWRIEATPDTADVRLTDGLDCTLEGEPQEEGRDDILARVTLDYARSQMQGISRRQLVYHGAQLPDRVRSVPTLYARRAQMRWCRRRGTALLPVETTIPADLVYRDDTADLWLRWLTRIRSAPWTVYRAVGTHRSPIAHLEPGMVVALSSTRYSLSRRVVHVRRAGWLGATCYADLVAIPDP